MRNINFGSEVERMKELMKHGENDAKLRSNVSETVEYKTKAPDGKIYGIVRERMKYFIKESVDDGLTFKYIGGAANKNEYEYPSYNSASRNLELKVRSINENLNTGKKFEVLPVDTTSEYIIEATQDMRNEIDRQRQIMMGVAKIMKENNSFINKPKFKDPESFGTATDPKKQGTPFVDAAKASLDKDPSFKATDPKKQGVPFVDSVKTGGDNIKTTKDHIAAGEPFTDKAEDVLGNSVATKKVSAKDFSNKHKSTVKESMYEDEDEYMGEGDYIEEEGDFYGDENEDVINEFEDFDYDLDFYDGEEDVDTEEEPFPTPSRVRYIGSNPALVSFFNKNGGVVDYVGQTANPEISYVMAVTGKGSDEKKVPTAELERVPMNEGIWDSFKGVASVGKHFAGKAKDSVAKVGQDLKNKVSAVGDEVSTIYNKSRAESSRAEVDRIANMLKKELTNLNDRTVKAGGAPLNYNSVLMSLSNKLRGQLKGIKSEGVDSDVMVDDDMVDEITEAVLNSFGKHHQYQKPAFTTPSGGDNKPYGQKIGNSEPFTKPVKQNVGDGEIGEDGDEVIKGKTQKGIPSLGKIGDKTPFNKPAAAKAPEAKKTVPTLGKDGDKKPFTVKTKKDVLNDLAESIIRDFKKKI